MIFRNSKRKLCHSDCSWIITFREIWLRSLISIKLNKYITVINCKSEFETKQLNIYNISSSKKNSVIGVQKLKPNTNPFFPNISLRSLSKSEYISKIWIFKTYRLVTIYSLSFSNGPVNLPQFTVFPPGFSKLTSNLVQILHQNLLINKLLLHKFSLLSFDN